VRRLVSLVCLIPLIAGACGDDGDAPAASGDELRGDVTVFAAASLTEAFTDAERDLEADHHGLSITFNFAGSQALVQQILQGAPADIVATADTETMQQLADAGRLDGAPAVLIHNTLAIAVAPGNPEGIRGLADLARPDLVVVLADPSVPAGRYAANALRLAGVRVTPRSLELDVKAALAKVTLGEADAAIVYRTDARAARGKAEEVAIPDAVNQFVSYPIAVVKGAPHPAAALALVQELTAGAGRRALLARGFRP
jgi:molybdate transport system substrate-binding protein